MGILNVSVWLMTLMGAYFGGWAYEYLEKIVLGFIFGLGLIFWEI